MSTDLSGIYQQSLFSKAVAISVAVYAGPQKLDRLLRYKKYVFVACPERGFNNGRDQKKAYA